MKSPFTELSIKLDSMLPQVGILNSLNDEYLCKKHDEIKILNYESKWRESRIAIFALYEQLYTSSKEEYRELAASMWSSIVNVNPSGYMDTDDKMAIDSGVAAIHDYLKTKGLARDEEDFCQDYLEKDYSGPRRCDWDG